CDGGHASTSVRSMVLPRGVIGGCLVLLLGAAGCEQDAYVSHVGSEGDTCPGECVPLGPLGWSDPLLLWTGPVQEAPGCPTRAPVPAYQGHADLVAPDECDPCACDPPTGSCAMPTDLTAYDNASCCGPGEPGCGPGAAAVSFDAPSA